MKSELIRLFLPVGAGVLLGLVFAFRGFLRAWRGAPDSPGIVRLLSGLVGASPVTKLFYAAILAFVAAQPGVEGVPRFAKADVFFVAGNVMGLMALAQGLVAAARMPKMLAFRGFLRAWREAPDSPGVVRLLAGLAATSPATKLFYAAILAFVAATPGVEGVPRFAKADVFFVAGNVMGLMALAQGFVAAARMPKMLAFRGPSGKPGAIPVTLMIQGFFETPAIFAMVFGMIALQMTN